jgi:hypothetical protein
MLVSANWNSHQRVAGPLRSAQLLPTAPATQTALDRRNRPPPAAADGNRPRSPPTGKVCGHDDAIDLTRQGAVALGVLFTPGATVFLTTIGASVVAACRLTTASPYHPGASHRPGMSDLRGINKDSMSFTLPAFPSPVTPGRNGRPWAFPWAPHPAVTSHARQGRDRSGTLTRVTSSASSRTSNRRTYS